MLAPLPLTCRAFGEKLAIEVERGGIGSRALASTLGHVGAFPVATTLSLRTHVNPSQWQGASGSVFDKTISPDDTRGQQHKQIAEDMAKTNPQELQDTMVYLGGPNLFKEYARLYKNPRSSLLGKTHTALTLPIQAALMNITRGSAYHPVTDSVYLMGDKPSVLTHELGHAIDFNAQPVPEHKPGTSKFKTWAKRQGKGLMRDLYMYSRMLPIVGGMAALPQEALANSLSLENLKKTYADQPEKLEKLLAERQKVLPGGYGSYIGGAIPAPLPGLNVVGALGGKIYGLAQHARRKGTYVATQNKIDEENQDDTEELLKFMRRDEDKKRGDDKAEVKDERKDNKRDEPRRKAASFGQWLRDAADNYNKSFERTYGVDIRAPHDLKAVRQMLIASAVGGGLGLGRGMLWPGYIEEKDKKGRIVAKRKRSPLLGALEGAAIGAGTSAVSNYASQMLAQYNPEIDKMLRSVKDKATNAFNAPKQLPPTAVDGTPQLLEAAGRLA